ncbi:polyphosphate polymerase domain-containing protein [Anaerovorax odorimutans]|uniref:polyphosphate polymerase domain-containing protein n=1 Tax=Anaerovorax odorimutans TaxID=109327 RepID=UPI0003FBD739|nr:polyphosphate polymerase domain-containing protein [Anaerovorax odorimutans]
MSYQNIFKRYELKYQITKEQKEELLKIMGDYMIPDKFGKSTISNLYFDTPNKLLIRRSLEKPKYKEKLRVRSYGVAKPDSTVFVELKKKYKGVVYKRRMSMKEQAAVDYLLNGFPLDNPSQISREIDYFMDLYDNIEPSVFLSYEREAFFSKTDENFRMTFDENILFRDYDFSLTNGIYGENILPQGMALLEVKTALGIPSWLLDFFSENKIYKTSFSKYGNAYKQLMLQKSLGGIKNVA